MSLAPERGLKQTEKLPFRAQVRQTITQELQKTATPKLTANLALSVTSTTAHIVSAIRGFDVTYTAGTRPLTRGRRLLSFMDISFGVFRVAINAKELATRTQSGSQAAIYGARSTSTEDLAGKVSSMAISVLLMGREVARGKSTFRGYRYSPYGRVLVVAQMSVQCAVIASAGYELYQRREEWLPAAKEVALDIKDELDYQRHSLSWRLKGGLPSDVQLSEADLDVFMEAIRRSLLEELDH